MTKCSDSRLCNRNVLFNGAGTCSDRTDDGSVQNDGYSAAEDDGGLAALASRPLSLTFAKRFGWTPHSTGVRSCQAKRLGFSKWKHLKGLTRDKALRVGIQKALAIAGKIDQGAGILFNLKLNGDYLALRANPLENNLVLWKFERANAARSNGSRTRRLRPRNGTNSSWSWIARK
jgi:hypothetical protein